MDDHQLVQRVVQGDEAAAAVPQLPVASPSVAVQRPQSIGTPGVVREAAANGPGGRYTGPPTRLPTSTATSLQSAARPIARGNSVVPFTGDTSPLIGLLASVACLGAAGAARLIQRGPGVTLPPPLPTDQEQHEEDAEEMQA